MEDNIRATQGRIILKHQRMKDLVFDILSRNERARNDDKWLILQVLQETNQQIVIGADAIVWHIPLDELGSIPNFETIRRVRQEIQNTNGMFLPTDPQVLFDRRIKEDAIKTYYSGQPEKIRQWQEIAYQVS